MSEAYVASTGIYVPFVHRDCGFCWVCNRKDASVSSIPSWCAKYWGCHILNNIYHGDGERFTI